MQQALPNSDVVVHVEPQRRGLDLRDRVLAAALAEPLVREAHDITIFQGGDGANVTLHLKFPADLPLDEAHAVSERVERAILGEREVRAVETHLEPLEQPIATVHANKLDLAARRRAVTRLVRARYGREPHEVRLLPTAAGLVLLLAVGVEPGVGLAEAHTLAGELEEVLRRQHPDLAVVVVHTEPQPG